LALQQRHIRGTIFGTGGFANSIRPFAAHCTGPAYYPEKYVEKLIRKIHIPPNYVVERVICSSKASGGEDLQVEHPVCCGYAPAFHFYTTLAGMLRPTLIRDQVIEVREPRQKRLLAAFGMMKPLHREQFPLDGIVRLI
jgi:hypothetical protein